MLAPMLTSVLTPYMLMMALFVLHTYLAIRCLFPVYSIDWNAAHLL